MTERTAVPARTPLSLGNMTGIDARRIIARQHGMGFGEMISLRARLGDWLRTLTALKENVSRDAAHCAPCLAFSLCDNIDITISETGIEEIIASLTEQIDSVVAGTGMDDIEKVINLILEQTDMGDVLPVGAP